MQDQTARRFRFAISAEDIAALRRQLDELGASARAVFDRLRSVSVTR